MKIRKRVFILLIILTALFAGCEWVDDPVDNPGDTNPPPVESGEPDLVIDSVTITSVTATRIYYDYTIKNIGKAPAYLKGPTDELYDDLGIQNYLSDDQVLHIDGDTPAGGSVIGGAPESLAPGESYSGSYSAGKNSGDTSPYLIILIDDGETVAESNEDNNTFAIEVLPDLIFESVTITSVTATRVYYDYTIKNTGNAPAYLKGATDELNDDLGIQNYLSDDQVLDINEDAPASGSVIGGAPESLAAGESYSGSYSAGKDSDDTSPYLIILIDDGYTVAESNEDNNTFAVEVLPDLIFDSVTITSVTATRIYYDYTIKNTGKAPAYLKGPTDGLIDDLGIQNYLSHDQVLDTTGDTPASGSVIWNAPESLAAGESYSGSYSAGRDSGDTSPYLIILLDNGKTVTETNKENNTFTIDVLPDLIIDSVTITSITSDTIYYDYTLKNIGEVSATMAPLVTMNYLSNDRVFDNAGDIAAGGGTYYFTGSLSAGESISKSYYAVKDAANASPYLTIMIDYGESFPEMNEDNNTIAVSLNP